MRRAPALVLAVLAALGLVAVGFHRPAPRASPAASSVPSPAAAPASVSSDPPSASVSPPAMLHFDARHTGRAPGRLPSTLPQVAWMRDVGGPVEAQVVASPDGQTLYVGSLGGTLTALARADGAVRWTLDLGDRVYATPCVAPDGTLYVGRDGKEGGRFVAVTPAGVVKWSLDTEGDADTGAGLAADGTVVFAAGARVYGVTPQGGLKFRFAARRKVFSAPALDPSGRVFFGSQDHHVYALTPQGGPLWRRDLGADVDGAPALGDDGAVYVGTDAGEVVRLDPEDGRVAWRAPLGGFVRGTLSVARGGDVLAGVYGPSPRAVRLRASDGAVVSSFPVPGTGSREFGVHGGAIEDEAGALVFGAQDDAVYALGPQGALQWRFKAAADVDSPPTPLGDGSLVIAGDDGKVILLRTR